MAEHPGQRLGARILSERAQRWPRREEFARETGLSVRLLADLETGSRTNFSARTFAAIEAALDWEPGTCEAITMGGRVTRFTDPEMRRLQQLWSRLDLSRKRAIVQLAELFTDA